MNELAEIFLNRKFLKWEISNGYKLVMQMHFDVEENENKQNEKCSSWLTAIVVGYILIAYNDNV